MAKAKSKKTTVEEPSVLDWFKSLLRGQPIPIVTEEERELTPKGRKAVAKPATTKPRAAVKTAPKSKVVRKVKEPTIDLSQIFESSRQWLGELPKKPGTWLGEVIQSIRAQPLRAGAFGAAWLLTVIALIRLPRMEPKDNYFSVFLIWIVAIGMYIFAVAPAFQVDRTEGRRLPKWFLGGLFGVVIVGFLLRLWKIDSIPFTLAGDEASQGLEAVRVIQGSIRNPFGTGWFGVPTLSFFYNAISIKLLGRTTEALRLPWALIGATTVLLVALVVSRMFGYRMGLATGLLLGTYHYHIHFSRLGSNQVADGFFMALALVLLYRSLKTGQTLAWVGVGATCALSLYWYAGARIVSFTVFLVILYFLLRGGRQFWVENRRGFVVAAGAFFLVGAPMLQYIAIFPEEYNSRLNQVGIIQSGWLDREVVILGLSKTEILLDQFMRAGLAFNFYPDRTVWYGLPEPLLDPIFGSLFLLGLGYSTVRIFLPRSDKRLFPFVAWWWGPIILGGVLTESPPSSMRLTTTAIPVCFFIALAMWKLILLAKKAYRGLPTNILFSIGVLLFSYISLKTYFIDFTPKRIYGGQHAELATEVAPLFNELKSSSSFYFFGPPHMYWGFSTIPYLVPGADAQDIMEPITAPPSRDFLISDNGAVFIFLPERSGELQLVEQAFPGGDQLDILRAYDGRMLGSIYHVKSP